MVLLAAKSESLAQYFPLSAFFSAKCYYIYTIENILP